MLLVELLHELAVERLYPGSHRHSVHGDNVLEDNSEGKNDDPEKLVRDLVLGLGDAFDLHLFFDSFNL